MSDSNTFTPGSRAIKIPLNGGNPNEYLSSDRQRNPKRNVSGIERTDTSDINTWSPDPWSETSPTSSSTSASSLRNRQGLGALLHTQKSIASPSDAISHTKGHNSTSSDSLHHRHGAITKRSSKDKHKAGTAARHSIGNTSPPNVAPTRPLISQSRTDSFASYNSPLGPSMLSSSSYKSINLTSHHQDSDEPARLITYTKHSQGFTWNDELFLPSYLMGRRFGGAGGSHRRRWGGYDDEDLDDVGDFDEEGDRCPVTDIFVTDEEAAAMMP